MTKQSDAKILLHYEIYGTGDPVLCIHGLGACLYTWRELIEPLSKDHQLILIDLKGYGASPKPRDGRYSVLDQAELIYQFIQEHNLKNLTLIGTSYGGAVSLMVSLMLCEAGDGRLSKLILIDSAGYNEALPWHFKLLKKPVLGWLSIHLVPGKASTRRVLRYVYYNPRLITREQIASYSRPVRSPGARQALLETARQAIPKDIDELTERYKDICVPTLIIWGEEDRVIPLKIGKMLAEAIPDSQLVVLPKIGHAPHEEAPEQTVPLIRQFLESPTGR
ncbi:MAG TPA: alpha/beta hydrolase [Pyrinomonadaceae bacterium]|nr:alpha/beta hydrolase [Pyrinomonadaceae bacterium]